MKLGMLEFQAGKIIENISSSDLKSLKSLDKQIQNHQKKLNDYVKNPDKFDNDGRLKAAGNNTELRNQIINGRVDKLNREIKTFEGNAEKIIKKYDKKND